MNKFTNHIQEMHRYFYTRRTYHINFRIYYLKKLKKSILNHQEDIIKALYKDFKKPAFETYTTEIYTTITEINHMLKNITKWTKGKNYGGVLPLIESTTKVMPEPYGVVLIFTPFNYPFQLAMIPLIGALVAGNCGIIKVSEYTPYTNKILRQIIEEVFPSYYVTIIEGDAKACEELLKEPLDYIFFTGSIEVGKKVMAAAAAHLVPVTLELGGKSPTIVDYDADIKLAAKRIAWGKCINAGQTCIAPDYVLVHENVAETFITELIKVLDKHYSNSKQIARIINEMHYVRLLQMMDEEKICYGGHFNTDDLYIEPTLLYPASIHDPAMSEEIFGPILPIIPFKRLDESIRLIQQRPKPLACYIFGEDKKRIQYLLKHISFGGGCVNDTILHSTHPEAAFGGVGYSGMGQYHGYHSFKTFSHEKTILISGKKELPFRFPPYAPKIPLIKKLIR